MENANTESIFKPGSGRALAYGWQKMKANFLVFFLAILVVGLFEMPLYSADGFSSNNENIIVSQQEDSEGERGGRDFGRDYGSSDSMPVYAFIIFIYGLLLIPIFKYGEDLIFLQGVRGDDTQVKNIFIGFKNYLNIILSSLLAMSLIGIGTIVFIIPGIYIACRLAFVSYLVMDEELDPIQAVEASWRITRGHAWKIFVLGFLSIWIWLFGLLLLFVGVFPATIWIKSSFAALYLSITEQGTENTLEHSSPDRENTNKASKPLLIGLAVIVIGVLALVINSHFFSPVNESSIPLTLEADTINILEIESGAGLLTIANSDGSSIEVIAEVRTSEDDYKLSLESTGDNAQLVANAGIDSSFRWFGNKQRSVIDLTVTIPRGMNLSINDGSGLITVNNIEGNIEISDGSGDIVLTGLTGSLTVNDGSGNMELTDIDGVLSISDGSGNIIIKNISNNVTINDGSGNISVTLIDGDLNLEDGSGNISVNEINGHSTIVSGSGSIAVNQLQGNLNLTQGSGRLSMHEVGGSITIN